MPHPCASLRWPPLRSLHSSILDSYDHISSFRKPLNNGELPESHVSSNVSVDVDSAQRSVHAAAETWKPPTQAWTKYQISAQAWKKTLERKMLPKGRVRQVICSKAIFYTIMLRLFHACSEQDYAPRCTFSTLALKQFVFPRLRWNPHHVSES